MVVILLDNAFALNLSYDITMVNTGGTSKSTKEQVSMETNYFLFYLCLSTDHYTFMVKGISVKVYKMKFLTVIQLDFVHTLNTFASKGFYLQFQSK